MALILGQLDPAQHLGGILRSLSKAAAGCLHVAEAQSQPKSSAACECVDLWTSTGVSWSLKELG